MSYNLKRKFFISLIFIFSLFAFDCLLSIYAYNQVFYTNYLFQFSFYILLTSIIYFFKSNKFSFIYSIIIIILHSIYIFINLLLFISSNDIFSINYILLFTTAMMVVNTSYIPWMIIILYIIIYSAIVGLFFLVFKFTKKDNKNLINSPQIIAITLLFIFAFTRGIALDSILSNNYDSDLYQNMNSSEIISFQSQTQKKQCLRLYGSFTYELGEINYLITPINISSDSIFDNNCSYSSEFTNSSVSFSEYNVITIMVETGCSFLVNKTLTPNLYSLTSNSFNFTNSYSKNKTNVSEFIGITGSGTNITNIMSGSLENKYSIVNVLKKKGYFTQYFHDNDKSFYNRGIEMSNLGFEKSYFANEINPEVIDDINKWNGSYPLDSEFVKLTKDKMIPEKSKTPFYTFFTTFSTHGPYGRNGSNYQKFIDLGYYDKLSQALENGDWENICSDDSLEIQAQVEYLQCAMMDFDCALGLIIDRLKETNQYDNTIIAIYGDHDAYYKSNNCEPLKEYVYNTTDFYDSKQYSIITMISNPKITEFYRKNNKLAPNQKINIDKFVSPYIIVPTLLDILGYEYNPNHYTGISVFRMKTDFDNIFYSHELGIYLSQDLTAIAQGAYKFDNDTTDEYKEKFEESLEILMQKVYYFDIIYKNGGFKENDDGSI